MCCCGNHNNCSDTENASQSQTSAQPVQQQAVPIQPIQLVQRASAQSNETMGKFTVELMPEAATIEAL